MGRDSSVNIHRDAALYTRVRYIHRDGSAERLARADSELELLSQMMDAELLSSQTAPAAVPQRKQPPPASAPVPPAPANKAAVAPLPPAPQPERPALSPVCVSTFSFGEPGPLNIKFGPRADGGARVLAVKPQSHAAKVGVRAGMVLRIVAGKEVDSIDWTFVRYPQPRIFRTLSYRYQVLGQVFTSQQVAGMY